MATRKRLRNLPEARKKIQTTQLVKRLTGHALGEVELSRTQVRAIEILLRKTLPDVSSVDITADVDMRATISAEPLTDEQWEQINCGEHKTKV